MGLISMVTALCCCYGLPWNALAVVFGAAALSQCNADPTLGGRGLATIGIIAAVLSVVEVIAVIVLAVGLNVGVLLLSLVAALIQG